MQHDEVLDIGQPDRRQSQPRRQYNAGIALRYPICFHLLSEHAGRFGWHLTLDDAEVGPLWQCRDVAGPVDRLSGYQAVSSELCSMSDAQLVAMLDRADHGAVGIGGVTRSIRVAATDVFVKLVRLTDRERDAGPACTSNLFDLPICYQYGVGAGSTGFNAWREVTAHQIVSGWVLDGGCSNFPLLYHWRALTRPEPQMSAAATTDHIESAVQFWGGSPAIEARLHALDESSTVVALFLEHFPLTLQHWLTGRLAAGPVEAEAAVRLVEQQLLRSVAYMRSAGMLHFDAHFANVLTDGQQIYLSDFGLATARRFQLSRLEKGFVRRTVDHDRAYCVTALVNTITATLVGLTDPTERNSYIRRCADTGGAALLVGTVGQTVVRYARVATVINDFYWQLHNGDFTVPYPAASIAAALRSAGDPA